MQLTDAQLVTICIAIIVPISALIHSNLRVSDAKEAINKRMDGLETALNKRLDETKETVRAEIQALDFKSTAMHTKLTTDLSAGFDRIENAMKIHVLEHHQ